MNTQFNSAYQSLSDEDGNVSLIVAPSVQLTKETTLMLKPDASSSALLVVDLSVKENIELTTFVERASVANTALDVAPLVFEDTPNTTLTFSLESDCDPYRLFMSVELKSCDSEKSFCVTLPVSTTANAFLNALKH